MHEVPIWKQVYLQTTVWKRSEAHYWLWKITTWPINCCFKHGKILFNCSVIDIFTHLQLLRHNKILWVCVYSVFTLTYRDNSVNTDSFWGIYYNSTEMLHELLKKTKITDKLLNVKLVVCPSILQFITILINIFLCLKWNFL